MKYLVRKVGDCPECGGRGCYDASPHCGYCGFEIPVEVLRNDDFWESNNELPCGHDIIELKEVKTCAECDGEGHIDIWVPLEEALADMGGKQDQGYERGYYYQERAAKIYFGLYAPNGEGCKCEAEVVWVDGVPAFESWGEAWELFASFADVFAKMAQLADKTISPEDFIAVLKGCGFKEFKVEE